MQHTARQSIYSTHSQVYYYGPRLSDPDQEHLYGRRISVDIALTVRMNVSENVTRVFSPHRRHINPDQDNVIT